MSKKNSKTAKRKKAQLVDLSHFMSEDDNTRQEEYKMFFAEERLKRFQDWPLEPDSTCNPQSLAEAGFYHIPSAGAPDACRCFCCFKELDGWEPEDDPWAEHAKHSRDCAFLALKKSITKLTVSEFFKLQCERQKNKIRKYFHVKIEEQENHAKTVETEMKKLLQ